MQEIIYSIGGKFVINWFMEAGDGSGWRGPEDPENPNPGRAVPTADGNDKPRQRDDVQGEIKRKEREIKRKRGGNKKEEGGKLSLQAGTGGVKPSSSPAQSSR